MTGSSQQSGLSLAEITYVRLGVLEQAIGALIATHPNPALFAAVLRQATALAQFERIAMGSRDAARAVATAAAREIIETAEDAAAARRPPGG